MGYAADLNGYSLHLQIFATISSRIKKNKAKGSSELLVPNSGLKSFKFSTLNSEQLLIFYARRAARGDQSVS